MLQTNDYLCTECGNVDTILVDTAQRDELQVCCACGAPSKRRPGAFITKTTHVDGVRRWDNIREARSLEKAAREVKKARRLGSIDSDTANAELSRIKQEKNDVLKRGQRLKAEIPVKGEG